MPKVNPLPGLRKEYRSAFENVQMKDDESPARLGDGQGNVRIDNTHSWIRFGATGTVMAIWNTRTAHVNDWEVVVGYEPGSNLFQVLRRRDPYLAQPYPLTEEHGAAHTLFHPQGGHDPVYVDIRQWMPLRVFPSGAFQLTVWRGKTFRNGVWGTIEIQTIDVSAHKPSDGARYVLVTLDATGALTAIAGTIVGDKYALQDSDIPVPPSKHYPLAVIRLYDTQASIVEQRDDTDIDDVRYPPYTSMAPASSSGGIAWDNVVVVAKNGGDYNTIQSAINSITDATSTNSYLILIMPGIYAENVTMKDWVALAALAGVHVSIKPATGVPVTVPATCLEQVNLERIQLAPQDGSAALSIDASSTADVVLERCHVVGPVAAAGPTNRRLIVGRTRTTGPVTCSMMLEAFLADFAASVTQTAAASCKLFGGNVDGTLTTFAGGTFNLFNLPKIAAVAGAGTLVGAYLNAGLHTVMSTGNVHKNVLIESRTSLYEHANFI